MCSVDVCVLFTRSFWIIYFDKYYVYVNPSLLMSPFPYLFKK